MRLLELCEGLPGPCWVAAGRSKVRYEYEARPTLGFAIRLLFFFAIAEIEEKGPLMRIRLHKYKIRHTWNPVIAENKDAVLRGRSASCHIGDVNFLFWR